jgi:flagellar motor switch protein FliM
MSTDPVLSQDEVDALLHGVDSGAVDTNAAPAPGGVRNYDLGKEARIVRGRLPALELINERFARLYRTSVFNIMRRTATVTVEGIQNVKFSDYIHRLEVPSSLNIVRIAPLRGSALIVLSPRLVFSVVDNFFGGKGRFAKIEGRDFTATENRMIQMLLTAAFNDLREAWSNVLKIQIDKVASEMNPQFANIIGPTEVIVVATFGIELEGNGGELHIALPYSMIEPIRELLHGGLPTEKSADDGRWTQSLREEIEDAEIDMTTRFARAQLTLADLLNLKPGDIVPCDFNGKVTVYAEDIPIVRGSFGVSRGQQAVKIEERVLHGRNVAAESAASKH